MNLSRRAFCGALSAADFARGAKRLPVRLGAQTTSFRGLTLEQIPGAMKKIGLDCAEIYQRHIEPAFKERAELKKWRLDASMDLFRGVRRSFDAAGVEVLAYYFNLRDDTADEEMERAFEMTRALGVRLIVSSSNISSVKRVVPHARRSGIRVALHNHSELKANELATPDDFQAALKGTPEEIGICLDVGHMTAANNDPVKFLKVHGGRIFSLHLKDRKRNQGADMPFGEGDTPVREVLAWLQGRGSAVPAMIEWEAKGPDSLAEVARCAGFCRKALA